MQSPRVSHVLDDVHNNRGQRRLDTLARMFEYNMTCAAVCLLGKRLYITTNTISSCFSGQNNPELNEPETQGYRFLKKMVSHLVSPSFRQEKGFSQIDRDIIRENYLGKLNTLYKGHLSTPSLVDIQINRIIDYLLNAKSTHDFMSNKSLSFFEEFLFTPEEYAIRQKNSERNHTDFFNKVLDVQRTFAGICRDVRDYRKFKQAVLSGTLAIEEYHILCVGQKDEHAEIRQLGFLLNHEEIFDAQEKLILKESVYLGISKLCCPYCVKTLDVLNKVVDINTEAYIGLQPQPMILQVADEANADEDELLSSSHHSEVSERELKRAALFDRDFLQTRGSHTLRFNWVFPAFVRAPIVHENWKIIVAKSQKKIPSNLKNGCVYALTKTNQVISRCSIGLTSSIGYSGKGAKKTFSTEDKAVEIGIYTKHLKGKKIDGRLLSEAAVYYGSGFVHQDVCCRWSAEANEAKFECSRLLENDAGRANMALLTKLNMSEQFLEGYQAVNEMVVAAEQAQVKMVPRTSSSSVESFDPVVQNRTDVEIASLSKLEIIITAQNLGSDEDAEDDSKKSPSSNSPKDDSFEQKIESEEKEGSQESITKNRVNKL